MAAPPPARPPATEYKHKRSQNQELCPTHYIIAIDLPYWIDYTEQVNVVIDKAHAGNVRVIDCGQIYNAVGPPRANAAVFQELTKLEASATTVVLVDFHHVAKQFAYRPHEYVVIDRLLYRIVQKIDFEAKPELFTGSFRPFFQSTYLQQIRNNLYPEVQSRNKGFQAAYDRLEVLKKLLLGLGKEYAATCLEQRTSGSDTQLDRELEREIQRQILHQISYALWMRFFGLNTISVLVRLQTRKAPPVSEIPKDNSRGAQSKQLKFKKRTGHDGPRPVAPRRHSPPCEPHYRRSTSPPARRSSHPYGRPDNWVRDQSRLSPKREWRGPDHPRHGDDRRSPPQQRSAYRDYPRVKFVRASNESATYDPPRRNEDHWPHRPVLREEDRRQQQLYNHL